MAWYKYSQFLQVSASNEYDKAYSPGQLVPFSGIYRCEGCGREIACNQGQPFPPQNHHQHPGTLLTGIKPITWRLIVFADGTPKD